MRFEDLLPRLLPGTILVLVKVPISQYRMHISSEAETNPSRKSVKAFTTLHQKETESAQQVVATHHQCQYESGEHRLDSIEISSHIRVGMRRKVTVSVYMCVFVLVCNLCYMP